MAIRGCCRAAPGAGGAATGVLLAASLSTDELDAGVEVCLDRQPPEFRAPERDVTTPRFPNGSTPGLSQSSPTMPASPLRGAMVLSAPGRVCAGHGIRSDRARHGMAPGRQVDAKMVAAWGLVDEWIDGEFTSRAGDLCRAPSGRRNFGVGEGMLRRRKRLSLEDVVVLDAYAVKQREDIL